MQRQLIDSVGVLKGVGPKKVQALNKLGISTIEDLLTYYPFRYDDLVVKQLGEIADGQKVAVKGVVASEPVLSHFGRAKSRLSFKLLVEHDVVLITFFNQAYLKKQLSTGQDIAIYGKYDSKRQSLAGMKILAVQSNDFVGVYRASKEIKASTIKQIIQLAYVTYADFLEDIVPVTLQHKYRLESRKQMIYDMHFPKTAKVAQLARRSAIFEEFFRFQVGIQLLKKSEHKEKGVRLQYDNTKIRAFITKLPFELTAAQKRVVNEICFDMHRDMHMNRLLQGDVGSGKTVIAAIAMYAAVTAGYQAALMVPTEILAQQHAEKFSQLFENFNVNLALLTGATSSRLKMRRELLKHLANGEIDLVIGTHALIQNDVEFSKLGLVVTDEQHRFGVEQRRILREKGLKPDVLTMTATPIPRTLAITAYGEMDVSVIDELPKGRKPIKTNWLKKEQMTEVLKFISSQIKQGRQAYVISPLIEESEMMDLQNAQEVWQNMKDYFAPHYKVGLLHGKMKSKEKDLVMQQFKNKELNVLVSTTVIEVGVDVPNATLMVILDADRFGLAQLHQLRGRVGRGQNESYCLLVANPQNDYGKARMKTMVETSDGFVIAQKDLELRGPGDVLGYKQSGIPDFKVGDPIADLKILQIAQNEAHKIIFAEDFENNTENIGLLHYLNRKLRLEKNFD
ncbi:ATP-dependent DNA helicase RecG [Ligilactobacillus sp. WILCCON 0076]|uniref:ATP-dependent DNA helicase RecG n=1 Tax=Ligilactobacillus ubinensis TaxID=2876789 RepID=A0A9X2FKP9_9LACO|nr:ATP-dependent DNA helicase RecG [Ligilactobacillus ubinensis]MCP0886989.1 ATP-dependent DNA helicase RecG [Ligilactobacillus ubinensis]